MVLQCGAAVTAVFQSNFNVDLEHAAHCFARQAPNLLVDQCPTRATQGLNKKVMASTHKWLWLTLGQSNNVGFTF
jgi:hypothetical protein